MRLVVIGIFLILGFHSYAEETVATSNPSGVVKESEIPVVLDASKKTSGTDSPLVRMALTLVVLGSVVAGAYIFVRRIRQRSTVSTQATDIKILTQHYLGPKKSLAIIRVAGESILIGVTDSNINLIKSLSLLDDDIPKEVPQQFAPVLKQAAGSTEIEAAASEDEFSIAGIRDVVSKRLKNMRSIE